MKRRPPAILLLAAMTFAGPALADAPAYLDDRSDPAALIRSLYNAIDRGETLRAWSYFEPQAVAEYESFAAGYADTAHVRLRLGEVREEGAAGSIYASLPVVVEASDRAGRVSVFAGCYRTRQIEPGVQGEPPFRPIRIHDGRLAPSPDGFDTARGDCSTPRTLIR